MDQLRRAGRGTAGEIVHFREEYGIAPARGVAGYAAAIDAAADDENVMDGNCVQRKIPPEFRSAAFSRRFRNRMGIISK
jgi:hypothetical protein